MTGGYVLLADCLSQQIAQAFDSAIASTGKSEACRL